MATSKKMQQVAEDFGYQLAFLKSDKELYSVFSKAVNGGWDAARFVAAVRATRWYKAHSESWRQNQQLRYSDPSTWEAKVNEQRASVRALAGSLGISVSVATINKLGVDAFMGGWSSEQLQRALTAAGKGALTGIGQAGSVEDSIRQTAYRNGVNVSDTWVKSWVTRVQNGQGTIENAQQALRETYGASVAPGFTKELAAGQDLYDLASPYMQTMAKTLEMNPGDVDLFDPTIRKALASSSDKDGQAGSVPLWQFERDLKKDKRWMATNNARDSVDNTVRSLGQIFGVGV